MIDLLAAALVAAVISALLVGCARRILAGRGVVDEPGERRSHTVPTPRGGGAGLVLTWVGWLALAGWLGNEPALWVLAIGSLAIAGLGLWDDLTPLPVGVRLAGQSLVAAGTLVALGQLGLSLPPAAWIAVFLALLWLINAYNFMDGIDGLAAWQAVFAAAGFAWLLSGPAATAALGLLAAVLGFLPWNWPRARIFLGDVGSTALGYGLGVLGLLGTAGGELGWALPLLLLAVFMVDAGATLALRIWRRERWYTPHRSHTYQVLATRGWSHAQVVGVYMAFNLLLVAPACWLASSGVIQAQTCIGVYAILLIAWWLGRK